MLRFDAKFEIRSRNSGSDFEKWSFLQQKDSYSKKAACDQFIGPQHEYQNGIRKGCLFAVMFLTNQNARNLKTRKSNTYGDGDTKWRCQKSSRSQFTQGSFSTF